MNSNSRNMPVHTRKTTPFVISLLSVFVLSSCSPKANKAQLQEKDPKVESQKSDPANKPEPAKNSDPISKVPGPANQAELDAAKQSSNGKPGAGGNTCVSDLVEPEIKERIIVVGKGTPESCTEAELSTILPLGGNVSFNCGSAKHTIKVTKQISVFRDIKMDGKGLITLDGDGTSGILKFERKHGIVIKNLTFSNGKVSNSFGGAIEADWQSTFLYVINSKFIKNTSTKDDAFYGGGAIHIHETPTVIYNSEFTGNKGANGGAISMLLSDLSIKNSTFLDNESFRSTKPGGGGGAVAWDGTAKGNDKKIVVCGSLFKGNKAKFQGGAIFSFLYIDEFEGVQTIIEKSRFENNSVEGHGLGGAVWHANGNLLVTESSFQGNKATAQGGALWLGNAGKFEFENTSIHDNIAQGASGTGGLGGGIMFTSGTAELRNVTVANNTAGFQGGGVYGDKRVSVANSIIANNIAKNDGKNWNIKNNCFNEMKGIGKNIQFPGKNSKDPSDKDCANGIQTADPLLNAAADNGGPTPTLSVKGGSPVFGVGSNCLNTDQTLKRRNVHCDIGAFENK